MHHLGVHHINLQNQNLILTKHLPLFIQKILQNISHHKSLGLESQVEYKTLANDLIGHEYSQADNTAQLYQKSVFHGQQQASFFLEHYFGLHLKYKNPRAPNDIHSIYVLIYEISQKIEIF